MPKFADILSSGILFVLGLVLVLYLIPAEIALPDYEVTMSPRLLPYICAIAITSLSLMLLITQFFDSSRSNEKSLSDWFTARESWALTTITALFVFCILLFEYVAPVAAGAVLIFGSQLILGERNPITLVVMPATLLLGAYLLFYKVLGTVVG